MCSDAFHVPPSPIPLVGVQAVALDQFGVFLAHLRDPLVARVLGQDGRRCNVTVRRIALDGGGVVHVEPTVGRFLVPRKGFEIVAIDQEVDRRRRRGRGQLFNDVADAGVHGDHVGLQNVDAVDDVVFDVLDAAREGVLTDVRGQLRHLLGRFDALRVAHAVVGKGAGVLGQDHGGSVHAAKEGAPAALVEPDFVRHFLVASW